MKIQHIEIAKIIATPFLCMALASCNLISEFWGFAPVGRDTPGTAVVIGIDNYPLPCNPIAPGPSQAAAAGAATLSADGWNTASTIDPSNFTNAQFTGDFNHNALFFVGHGFTGTLVFPGVCPYVNSPQSPPTSSYWGPGDISSSVGYSKNVGSFSGNSSLDWMFLISSDTVAPEASQDPADAGNANGSEYVANPWEPLFYQAGLKLRGIYGYWQSSGNCDIPGADDNRACDVQSYDNFGVMNTLLGQIWSTNNSGLEDIPDAWQQANEDNNESGSWSRQVDAGAENDLFTPSSLSGLDGTLQFDSPYTDNSAGSAITVPAAGGTLEPRGLIDESLNVSGGVATADSDLSAGSYTTTSVGPATRYTSSGGLIVSYYQGESGGVTYHGRSLTNPMVISQSTAESAAATFVGNTFGMPSNAILTDALSVYRKTTSGSDVRIGYEFVWTPSAGELYGGDAIKVDVEDDHYVASSTCTQYEYIPGPSHPIRICLEWTYTYADEPNISYGYRLWRSLGSGVVRTQSGGSSGGRAVDAYTASLAVPESESITSYALSYWTGPIWSATIAEPAWIYRTQGGRTYAVDAASGAEIGSESL